MGIREYARHRKAAGLPGGALNAVQVAIRNGRIPASALTKDGKKIRSAKAADAAWLASTKADMVPLTGPTAPASSQPTAAAEPPVNDLAVARARRESATARMAELELAKAEGEVVPARDVEARLSDVFLRCRTKLLGVVTRAREADPTLADSQLRMIEGLITESLEELANGGARA